jgi:hypothetical protein
MKKSIIAGVLFTIMMLAAPLIGNSSCTAKRYCGSVGEIECSGIDGTCFGSPLGVADPWVKCNGIKNYCYGGPV